MTVQVLDYQRSEQSDRGYGRMGGDVARLLAARGVEFTPDADTRLMACPLAGMEGWYSHQRTVLWTMWEADRLPDAHVPTVKPLDLVLVPCRQNVETFSEHHPNVRRMPLGLSDKWQPTPRPDGGPFVFLAGGRGWNRKGFDVTIAAFIAADVDAELWIRAEGRIPSGPHDTHPRIRFVPRVADEVALFAQAHAFIALSRGEGFGFMPLQAMAQGCPTILTDAHGHADFSHRGIGIPATKRRSLMHDVGDPHFWWEPDLDEAVDAIRWVHANYTSAVAAAQLEAELVCRDFRWDLDRLFRLIGDTARVPTRGSFIPWREARDQLVRVTREVNATIGPWSVRMSPGVDYFHTWDVKRVLHESGALEPALWLDTYSEAVAQ